MFDVLTVLLIFMVITAIAAVHMRGLLSAVIALGALGFGASVSFLLLGAPDVAIPQVAVDVLTVIILIRATVGRDVKTTHEVRDTYGIAVSIVLLAIFVVFAVKAVDRMPPVGRAGAFVEAAPATETTEAVLANAGAPSHTYLAESSRKTGATNAVTGVLLDFRGYDTLGEATVLFAAILGAVVLLRKRSRRAEPSSEGSQ